MKKYEMFNISYLAKFRRVFFLQISTTDIQIFLISSKLKANLF